MASTVGVVSELTDSLARGDVGARERALRVIEGYFGGEVSVADVGDYTVVVTQFPGDGVPDEYDLDDYLQWEWECSHLRGRK